MEETQVLMDETLQVLMTGIVLALFTSFLAWKFGFYKMPKEAEGSKLPLNVVITAFAIFLSLSVLIVPMIFLVSLYISGNMAPSPETLILINSVSILASFLSLGVYQAFLSHENRQLILGKNFGKHPFSDVAIAVVAWFTSLPLVMIAGRIVVLILLLFGIVSSSSQVAVTQVKESLEYPYLFYFLAGDVVLFVPIIEEFIFRGCLQTWIKGKIGVKKAILLTSLIFAFFHFSISQGVGNIELLASLFVLSCFLGFIYERQQSLLSSISLHALFNGVTVLMIMLS